MATTQRNTERTEPLQEVLYYPYMNFRSIDMVKKALLLYDKIYLIYPTEGWRDAGIAVDDIGVAEKVEDAAFREHHYNLEEFVNKGWFDIVPANHLAAEYTQEFRQQLELDKSDPAIAKLAEKVGASSGTHDWYIYDQKIPYTVLEEYGLDRYRSQGERGHSLLRLPFVEGSSIMTTHALCAALSHECPLSLITDDLVQQEFLQLKLRRGWYQLQSNPRLLDDIGRESDINQEILMAQLAERAVSLALPSVITNPHYNHPQEIMEFREHHSAELKAFRDGLARLAAQKEISWESGDIRAFERDVHRIVKDEILPAFQELEGNPKITWKDIVHGITGSDIMKLAGLSGANSIVVGSLANLPGVAAGGPAFFAAAIASLGIFGVAKLWDVYREKKKALMGKEYLSYLVQAKAALSP